MGYNVEHPEMISQITQNDKVADLEFYSLKLRLLPDSIK